MLSIGELVLLLLVFLFTGGALSRLARWVLLRRTSGSKQVLWALTDWMKGRRATDPSASAAVETPSVSQKDNGGPPSPSEARADEETPPPATGFPGP